MTDVTLSPRLAVLDVLWRCGFPAAMGGPADVLPAVVVWMDEPDDPALPILTRAFGGHLMLELRDHHGEPTPSFWLGVGRSAVLASGALARWRASEPTDGTGTRLGSGAPAIWRAFEELCEAVLPPKHGADVAPAAHADDVRAAADALGRQVDAALPIASHIVSGLALALGSVLKSDARASSAHVLPTPSEREAWVDVFLTRLRESA